MCVSKMFLAVALSAAVWAQAPNAGLPPVGMATAGIEAAAQRASQDLGRVRIEKWKTDSGNRQQMLHNQDSLLRSLNDTLPQQTAQARSAADVASMFHLYRTLSATCDVMRDVAESAGAFGSRSEYESLAQDLQQLGDARTQLANAIEQAAQQQSAQIAAMRNAATPAAANTQSGPRKIIVDNDSPAPTKKTRKKKPAASTDSSTPKQ